MNHTKRSAAEADEYFTAYLNRTIMLLGEEAVKLLRTKTIAVSGCGGVGGGAALTLARMGVGNFILADPKPFDMSNINRQWAANKNTLGRNKAEVYEEMLLAINPDIKIRTHTEGITFDNIDEFLRGADLLIDCLDSSVPGAMRKKLFIHAREKGLHCFTSAMLGFGGMVAGAFPSGLPLEILGNNEDTAINSSKIPRKVHEFMVSEFIDLVEKNLSVFRTPTVSISPAVLATITSVEAVMVLLGNTIPGWRPPICLPNIIFVDLARMNLKVVHIDELLVDDVAPILADTNTLPMPAALNEQQRKDLLSNVGYNTNLLPHARVEIDLITDSWSEIPHEASALKPMDTPWSSASLDQVIIGYYGYKYVVPVLRGRFAEALLCKTLFRPDMIGATVLTSTLFPTTRFHIESTGFITEEIMIDEAYNTQNDHPFKGNIDIEKLKKKLASGERIRAVYIELCNNALGGHPVSMQNLKGVRALTAAHNIPVFLDACRAFENAQLIREREAGYAQKSLVNIVQEICSYSDATASSCAKDFICEDGGFVAMNDEATFTTVFDLTLAFGNGLHEPQRKHLIQSLSVSPDSPESSAGRANQSQRLWKILKSMGVPVTTPYGGHGVFIDIGALVPHIPADQFPGQALANELFITGGIRASVNFSSTELHKRNIHLLRLAIPIHYCTDNDLQKIAKVFEVIMKKKDKIAGLRKVGGPPGIAGEYAAEYRPIN